MHKSNFDIQNAVVVINVHDQRPVVSFASTAAAHEALDPERGHYDEPGKARRNRYVLLDAEEAAPILREIRRVLP
jgi:hypothetical protein